MLVTLLSCLVLGSPAAPAAVDAPSGALRVPQRPAEPGLMRDVVWPALGAGAVGRWRIEPTALARERLLSANAEGAGVLWASQDAEANLRLHRVLFAPRTQLTDTLILPAGAPPAAVAEAVRLRVEFLLQAPASAGAPWQPVAAPPPMPTLVSIPQAQRDDLVTRRAPPVPPRTARVPDPPPPLPVVDAVHDEAVGGPVDRPVEMAVGVDALASSGGLDAGLAGRLAFPVGALWWIGASGRLHPFHDARRDGRPLGVTGYSAWIDVERRVWQTSSARLSARAGVGVDGLSVVGAGGRSDGPQPALSLAAPVRVPLFGPVALDLDAGVVLALSERRALHDDEVLVSRGAIQGRVGVLLGWVLR